MQSKKHILLDQPNFFWVEKSAGRCTKSVENLQSVRGAVKHIKGIRRFVHEKRMR